MSRFLKRPVVYLFLFNLVSCTGLYLATIALVSPSSQFLYVHNSAYDWLLAFFISSFKSMVTFILFFGPVLSISNSLPAGWTAVTKSNYGYNVRLPCGQHRVCSRNSAFAFLAANPLLSNNNNNNNNASKPLWHTTEHRWLGRSIWWEQSGWGQHRSLTTTTMTASGPKSVHVDAVLCGAICLKPPVTRPCPSRRRCAIAWL